MKKNSIVFLVFFVLSLLFSDGVFGAQLSESQRNKLKEYAQGTVRYFTSPESNNLTTGFTHSYFGTGSWQEWNGDEFAEKANPLARGYGSYSTVNEITLKMLSLAAAYKEGWLSYLDSSDRYAQSWSEILKGLRSLKQLQRSGSVLQFKNDHFYRYYLNCNPATDDDSDIAGTVGNGVDEQTSDDNALAYINLCLLEGLALDLPDNSPNKSAIINLCHDVRDAIRLDDFIDGSNRIILNYTENVMSEDTWDRVAAQGSLVLTAMLLSGQIDVATFYDVATTLVKPTVNWINPDLSVQAIGQSTRQSALFEHGLRSVHGCPVSSDEFSGLNYYETSLLPVTESHLAYSVSNGFKALGTQVKTQRIYDLDMFSYAPGWPVQFAGNEDGIMPLYDEFTPGANGLGKATGPHAWFVPLCRWREMDQADVDLIFDWASQYEADFFHTGSDTDLGWEAAIPWMPGDTSYAWRDSSGNYRYTDKGRPYEALNSGYTVLSIFDALNDRTLSSYNIEAKRLRHIFSYFDSGTPLDAAMFSTDVSNPYIPKRVDVGITNSSFEEAGSSSIFNGWENEGNVSLASVSPLAGDNHVKLEGTANVSQKVDALAGQKWGASVNVMLPSSDPLVEGNAAFLEIAFLNQEGTVIGDPLSSDALNYHYGTDEYIFLFITESVAPVGTTQVQITLKLNANGESCGAVYFDDAALYRMGKNEFVNGSFEEAGDGDTIFKGWKAVFSNNNVSQESFASRGGEKHGKAFGNFSGTPNYTVVSQDLIAKPGQEWKAGIHVMLDSSDPLEAGNFIRLELKFIDDGGQQVEIIQSENLTYLSEHDIYHELSVTGTAPAHTSKVQIAFVFEQNNFGIWPGGCVYFDDAYLTQTAIGIGSKADLENIAYDLKGNYYLTADIDLEGDTFNPIAGLATPFEGTFDGRGYAIKNATINTPASDYVGIFGVIDGADIRNLKLENVTFSGNAYVGAIAGLAVDSTILNSYATGDINATAGSAGGLIGELRNSTLKNSYAYTDIQTGGNQAGALVGVNTKNAVISDCYAQGTLNSTASQGMIGGLVGLNTTDSNLKNCYAVTNMTANAGSLVGAGIGYNDSGLTTNCLFDSEKVSFAGIGENHVVGATLTGLETVQMNDSLNYPNWNFESTWQMATYPHLKMEYIATGDFNGDGNIDMVWRNKATGNIYIYLVDGATITTHNLLIIVPSSYEVRPVNDLNGDGKDDIVLKELGSDRVYILLMDGASIISEDWKWNYGEGVIDHQRLNDFNWYNSYYAMAKDTDTDDIYVWGETSSMTPEKVLFEFKVDNAAQMMIGEATDGEWETFRPSKYVTLSDGLGTKTVQVKFKTASGIEFGEQSVTIHVSQDNPGNVIA